MRVGGDAQTRQLMETATRLFAELGFDGTSMRLIAEAAGVDVDVLTAQVGDKTRLYREVMKRAYHIERDALEAAIAHFVPTVDGLIELADAYLDFYAGHPQILALWMHRWLGDAVDVTGLEERYSQPLVDMVIDAVRDQIPPDVDADQLLWVIVWSVYGFLSGGLQHLRAQLTGEPGPEWRHDIDAAALNRFRAFLHTLIRRMTAPAG